MEDRIERLARRALAGQSQRVDIDAYVRVFAEGDDAHVLRMGRAMRAYLLDAACDVPADELIVGDANLGALGRIPGFSIDYMPIPERYGPTYERLWFGAGNHRTANFERLLKRGLIGYREDIARARQTHAEDAEKRDFLDALAMLCEGMLGYADTCARACREAARAQSGERRRELEEMAAVCARVPRHPADSFREAVQSYWFLFLFFPDGVGRLDQYLYPYYRRDVERGALTPAHALACIEALFIRIFRVLGPSEDRSGNNHMVIGGYTPDLRDGWNAVSELILQAVVELPTWRPQVTCRWTKHTTDAQLRRMLAANRSRFDLVMITNDDVMIRGIHALGIPPHDAVQYSLSGCSEMVITGMSQMGSMQGYLNLLVALLDTMERGGEYEDFEAFYAELARRLGEHVESIVELSEYWDSHRARGIDLPSSMFTDGCIERGVPISQGGAKYNGCTWCATGLINLADSLCALREFAFARRKYSLSQMRAAIAADWQGCEPMRADIVANGAYFGSDDARPVEMANRIIGTLCGFLEGKTPYRGGRYTFGTLAGYELSHLRMGAHTGATPDGRRAGEPLTPSVAAQPGRDRDGVTAFLRAAAALDYEKMPNAVVVNLALDRALSDTDEKLDKLTQLIRVYLEMGGVQLQINYIGEKELLDARIHPEKHGGLRVRVTGFSGFFVGFDGKLQEEIIERTRHGG